MSSTRTRYPAEVTLAHVAAKSRASSDGPSTPGSGSFRSAYHRTSALSAGVEPDEMSALCGGVRSVTA